MQFLEEDLLATAAQGAGYFIASPGTTLKDGRYKIVRKLGSGRWSSTFLVKDLHFTSPSYAAIKVLTASATHALQYNVIHELDILQAVTNHDCLVPTALPCVLDHFARKGPHGVHYCFVFPLMGISVFAYRAATPTRSLPVYVVKPIVARVLYALEALQDLGVIHADLKEDNILLWPSVDSSRVDLVAHEPALVDGEFEFAGARYPILRSQPFYPPVSAAEITPLDSELISVALYDFGSALWVNEPKPEGDIGALALRAPENIVRADCGTGIDIWALGCVTYEMLTGQALFHPKATEDLTADESLLLMQYALTGETLHRDKLRDVREWDTYCDESGNLIKATTHVYPRRSLTDLLSENSDLTSKQVERAAAFIGACLRLNADDRPDAKDLGRHNWLGDAFMGCMDD